MFWTRQKLKLATSFLNFELSIVMTWIYFRWRNDRDTLSEILPTHHILTYAVSQNIATCTYFTSSTFLSDFGCCSI